MKRKEELEIEVVDSPYLGKGIYRLEPNGRMTLVHLAYIQNIGICELTDFYMMHRYGLNSYEFNCYLKDRDSALKKYLPKKAIRVGHSGKTCWFEDKDGDLFFAWMTMRSPSERKREEIINELRNKQERDKFKSTIEVKNKKSKEQEGSLF